MAERATLRADLSTDLAEKTLREIADRLEDRPRIMGTVTAFAEAWQEEVVSSEGAAAGQPWQPLKASTIALKGSSRPLERTGVLKRALTGGARTLSASVQIKGPEYAKYAKAGRRYPGKGPGGDMPRRNPTPLPPRGKLAELMSELLGVINPDGT